MNLYEVNMAKDVTPNAKVRHGRYMLVMVYLVFCAVLLIEACSRAFDKKSLNDSNLAEAIRIDRAFFDEHKTTDDMKTFAEKLKTRVAVNKSTILKLNSSLPAEVPYASVLAALVPTLPSLGEVIAFEPNKSDNSCFVSVRLILDGSENEVDYDEMLVNWREDAKLKDFVETVTLLEVEDDFFVQGVPAVVLEARLGLKKGAK